MIDILHPAHVHFFKNLYFEMTAAGHSVLVTARRKDCATSLLDQLDIPYTCISDSKRSPGAQLWEFLSRSAKFALLARSFRPDALAGIMGPTIAVVGKLFRFPTYVFYDTEFAETTNRFVYPLATKVITPECYNRPVRGNHVRYAGYHELAYLHPHRFTPQEAAVRAAGIDPEVPYVVVRFVGWWATHDRNERGLNADQQIRIVRALEKYGNVVVSSEADVPNEIADRVYAGPIEELHNLLAFAALYYGESATMASESAVLGTPAIYIATTGRGYTDDQACYGLVHDYRDEEFEESLAQAEALFAQPERTTRRAMLARQELLADKIDVTQFMLDLFTRDFGAQPPTGCNAHSSQTPSLLHGNCRLSRTG